MMSRKTRLHQDILAIVNEELNVDNIHCDLPLEREARDECSDVFCISVS